MQYSYFYITSWALQNDFISNSICSFGCAESAHRSKHQGAQKLICEPTQNPSDCLLYHSTNKPFRKISPKSIYTVVRNLAHKYTDTKIHTFQVFYNLLACSKEETRLIQDYWYWTLTEVASLSFFVDKNGGIKNAFFGAGPFWLGAADLLIPKKILTNCTQNNIINKYKKDPAPILYIYPMKSPLLMIKYELSTSCRWCFLSWVQLHQQMGSAIAGYCKNCPAHKLCYAPLRKIPFINAVKPFLWVSTKCA